jgi:short-subunit dehydrogenase
MKIDMKKNILITGANGGIGAAVVINLMLSSVRKIFYQCMEKKFY